MDIPKTFYRQIADLSTADNQPRSITGFFSWTYFIYFIVNPRRYRPFRILPRHTGGGGGGTTPRAVSPLIELELREKNEHVARREKKRLVYKLMQVGCTLSQYADDTQILVSGPKSTLSDLATKLELSLHSLDAYFRSSRLKINESKFELMFIGSRQNLSNLPQFSVKFRQTILTPCTEAKNLGATFDRFYSLGLPCIPADTEKCIGILTGISHIRHHLPSATLPIFDPALVLSHVRYFLSVYGNGSAKNFAANNKILYFSARVISEKKNTSPPSSPAMAGPIPPSWSKHKPCACSTRSGELGSLSRWLRSSVPMLSATTTAVVPGQDHLFSLPAYVARWRRRGSLHAARLPSTTAYRESSSTCLRLSLQTNFDSASQK